MVAYLTLHKKINSILIKDLNATANIKYLELNIVMYLHDPEIVLS